MELTRFFGHKNLGTAFPCCENNVFCFKNLSPRAITLSTI
jgi:hypothetical protein